MALIHLIGKQATIALLFIIVFSASAAIAIPMAISNSSTANNGGILPENSDKTLGVSPMAIVDRGVVINVNSTSDVVNGDVQSVQSLIANPGEDGISLREAITATNNDPGTYTIRFDPALNGTTINIDSQSDLPALDGGNVTINGDIYRNGNPGVTICKSGGPTAGTGFVIASSQNTIYSMRTQNFEVGFCFFSLLTNGTFADNLVSNCVVLNSLEGINLGTESTVDIGFAVETDITWVNTQICGNTLNSKDSGISLGLGNSKGNNLTSTLILNNTIKGLSGGCGVGLGAGFLPGSVNNRISDVLIANNTIHDSPDCGIALGAGPVGACDNSIDNVRIIDNDISLNATSDNGSGMIVNEGIIVMTGDASSDFYDPNYRPVTYPENNNITNVWILGNKITGASHCGVCLNVGCEGGNHNKIHNINIVNNTMTNIGNDFPNSYGVQVTGGGDRNPLTNTYSGWSEISDITIQTNIINVMPYAFLPQCGGIIVEGGEQGSCNNIVKNVTITGNDVFDQGEVAISVIGGQGSNDESTLAYNNTVSQVEISFNKVNARSQDIAENLSRMWVFGGLYWSTGNVVEKVNIAYNLEGGLPGIPLVVPNAGNNSGLDFTANMVATANVINHLSIASVYSIQVDQKQFPIDVKTNSSVSGVSFDQVNKALSISLNGPLETYQFANVTFPKTLLDGTFNVSADGKIIPFQLVENSTNYSLYTTYPNGTSTLQITVLSPEPTPTPTPSPTAAPTSAPTPKPAPTITPSPTVAPSPTSSPTPSPTTVPATTDTGATVELTISGNVTSTQISNITIATDQSATSTTVSFTVTGVSGTTGFGNVTIPKSAVPYGTTPTIYIDNQPAQDQGYTQDSTNYYVWYTTSFSTHEVSIVFTAASSSSLPLEAIYGIAVAVAIVAIVAVVLMLRKHGKGKS